MYFTVVNARHIEGYKLEIAFENGKKGVADLQRYAEKGGVFDRFSDLEYFKRFHVNKEAGTLCWPDNVDIAPETLYHEATDEPLPSWMTAEGEQEDVRKLVR
ncbi:MAG: DUF2442 domain-containing protein [Nitrospinae bacterium]|nr:DUF2442 domain-containing protein [Nitrospinota bacterium]